MTIQWSLAELKQYQNKWSGRTIGLVPTMGNLHDGHASLIQLAKAHCDVVVVSVFVNPTQFAPHEDFDAYPRTLDADIARCHVLGVDGVLAPTVAEIYPENNMDARYTPHPDVAGCLCGKTRPHFFYGVCNVVERLFSLVMPTHAFFGDKDIQQRVIIEQMVRDLNLDITIVSGSIIRDANGVALSSRNRLLATKYHDKVPLISKVLHDGCLHVRRDGWDSFRWRQFVAAQLEGRGFRGDYVAVFRPHTASEITGDIHPGDYGCVAVYCGDVRLIDNRLIL
ncbi:MAG: pantoate--beta-alanine ligase [Candidatus Marinamargulisbacteria bacterium]